MCSGSPEDGPRVVFMVDLWHPNVAAAERQALDYIFTPGRWKRAVRRKGSTISIVLTVWDECKGKDRVLRTRVSSSSIRTFTLTFPIGTASVETSMYRHYCTLLSVFTELFKSNHSKNLLVNCAWEDALAFTLFLQFSCRVTFIPSECHSIISPKALTVNRTWKCTFCQV